MEAVLYPHRVEYYKSVYVHLFLEVEFPISNGIFCSYIIPIFVSVQIVSILWMQSTVQHWSYQILKGPSFPENRKLSYIVLAQFIMLLLTPSNLQLVDYLVYNPRLNFLRLVTFFNFEAKLPKGRYLEDIKRSILELITDRFLLQMSEKKLGLCYDILYEFAWK